MTILITGGTGRLGRPTVATFRSRGLDVRILSRRAGDGHVVADLATGDGLAAALDGVDTVVHLATSRSKDIGQTHRLLDAMAGLRSRGTGAHLIFLSIVGVDRIPYGYYRDKVASERAIEASGVAYTILRATQFHGFVHEVLEAQRRLPVTLVLPVSAQTIHMPEVAERLVDLVAAGPSGRVADLGGPEQLTLRTYAQQWQAARGVRRPIWALHLPGKTVAAFRAGHHMSGLPGSGRVTYREFLGGGRMTPLLRVALAVLAINELVVGAWNQFAPESFYENFPTVELTPPFSEHYARDFGGATLGIAVLLVVAFLRPRGGFVLPAGIAYTVFSIPHFVFHAVHLDHATGAEAAFLIIGNAIVTLLGVLVIVLAMLRMTRDRRAGSADTGIRDPALG